MEFVHLPIELDFPLYPHPRVSRFQNCADARMSDKRVYHTFARTLPPASKVSKSVVALLRAFGWGSFVVVAGKQPAWSTGVKDAIEVNNYQPSFKSLYFQEIYKFI